MPRSATLRSWRGGRVPVSGIAGARHLVDEAPALRIGRGDQIEQARVQHHRRKELTAGLEQLDV